MATLRKINTALSFLLEIAMFVALGYWGFYTGGSLWQKLLLGIGVPVAVFVVWGMLLAPRAGQRISTTLGVGLSLILFYLAALALFQINQPLLGGVMLVVAAINRTLVVVWKQ